jgi:hypothetical protein
MKILKNTKRLSGILAITFFVSVAGFIVSAMLTTGIGFNSYFSIAPLFADSVGDSEFTFTESYSDISVIVTSSNASIKPSADGVTRVFYTAESVPARLEAEIRNDTLYVRERWSGALISFGWFGATSSLIIEIPEKDYNNISLTLTSGRLNTDTLELNCQSLDLKITSGNLSVTGITPQEYSVICTSGVLNLHNAAGSGNVRVTSGNVTIDYDDWNDSLKVSVTSGGLTFKLPEDSGIRAESRVTSGTVRYSLGEESGRLTTVSGGNFGGGNVQDVEIRVTSGSVAFIVGQF